jgi:hypothetical protein
MLGNGDGTFQAKRNSGSIYAASWVAVGDFNGDGKPDLAVPSVDGGVGVMLGNGDGTFQAPVIYAAGSDPYSIAVGDFNGDGKADIAVANLSSNTVGLFLGNGDGTFQAQESIAVPNAPSSLATGDFNGDGRTDLAVTDYGSTTVTVLLGIPVAKTRKTTTTLNSSPNPSNLNQSVTLTATVSPSVATVATASLSAGEHALTATYNGNVNDLSSTSSVVNQDVLPASSVSLAVSPNPSTFGQIVTLTTVVAPSTATGSVTFYDGPITLGTVALSDSTAVFSISTLSVGSHPLRAGYDGDANNLPETSPIVTEVLVAERNETKHSGGRADLREHCNHSHRGDPRRTVLQQRLLDRDAYRTEDSGLAPRLYAVPATPFRRVESIVGLTNQRVRVAAVSGANACDAKTRSDDAERTFAVGNLQVQNCDGDRLGYRSRRIRKRGPQKDDELLPAVPGDELTRDWQASSKSPGNLLEAGVAQLMAVGVIEALKKINVEIDQR